MSSTPSNSIVPATLSGHPNPILANTHIPNSYSIVPNGYGVYLAPFQNAPTNTNPNSYLYPTQYPSNLKSHVTTGMNSLTNAQHLSNSAQNNLNNIVLQQQQSRLLQQPLLRPAPSIAPAPSIQMNAAVDSQTYIQLAKHPNFVSNRSPFFHLEKRVCVIPVFAMKRIQFRVTLENEDLANLNSSGTSKNKYALHLRLFSMTTTKHEEWGTSSCDVQINQRKLNIDKKNTRVGIKEKGYQIVKPLDITKEANITMGFEITSNQTFHGVAVIEYVKVFSVEEIAQRVVQRCQPVESKEKKCAICNKEQNLLRCSRCKAVWYCNTKHQAKDWPYHQTVCQPAELKPKLQSIEFENKDDEIVCSETRVSLRCPLSICRIITPIRGAKCSHAQCIDLIAFLSFSHRTSNWQCPVCIQPLRYEEIVVDEPMKKILLEADEEIDQVRLYPDGSYKSITLEEVREEDKKTQFIVKRKKRKLLSPEGIDRLPPNLRNNIDNSSTDPPSSPITPNDHLNHNNNILHPILSDKTLENNIPLQSGQNQSINQISSTSASSSSSSSSSSLAISNRNFQNGVTSDIITNSSPEDEEGQTLHCPIVLDDD